MGIEEQRTKPPQAVTAAIVAAVSGSAAGILTELIFYGLDSYKIARQAGEQVQPSRLFRGAVPLAVLGSGPSFGVFFFLYTWSSEQLRLRLDGVADPSVAVLCASAVSAVPASLVGVPADFVKKQVIIANRSLLQVVRSTSVKGMFIGWEVNLLREIPFAGLKMSLYDAAARIYLRFSSSSSSSRRSSSSSGASAAVHALSSAESAGVGCVSGVVTAVLTCPLDCANTRIKSGELAHVPTLRVPLHIARQDGAAALFRGLGPRAAILGLGSTVFWYFQTAARNRLSCRISGGSSSSSGWL